MKEIGRQKIQDKITISISKENSNAQQLKFMNYRQAQKLKDFKKLSNNKSVITNTCNINVIAYKQKTGN